MALTNVLLCRWADGYHEVEDAASVAARGRREGFLSLGAVQSVEEVERVANALFAFLAEPRVSTTAGLLPTGLGDEPYEDFEVADYLTAPAPDETPESVRVRALAVTEDAEGNPVFVPELRQTLLEREDRLQRWLKRMANGALGGVAESAAPRSTPTTTVSPQGLVELPPFSLAGIMRVSVSPRYYSPVVVRLTKLVVSLGTAGTTTTTVELRKNGGAIASVSLGAGETFATTALSDGMVNDLDYLQVAVTAAGSGAEDLDVQVRCRQ